MKSKTTIYWLVLAVALAAAIWTLNRFAQPAAGERPVFAGLRPDRVTSLQIIPAGAREISVIRTNQMWLLDKPIVYPAQTAAIEGLLGALQKLTPVLTFTAGEMNGRKNADAEFGFDNPQYTLDVAAGDETWHLRVGNKTAPGDGVYVRVVGTTGAFVTGTGWLQYLKRDANDWRDTTLVTVPDALDWLVITNGTQAIELRQDVTNRLWRMVRPLPARANNLRVVMAIQQLRSARVSRFVNDDPKADLTAYGLELAAVAPGNPNPPLDIWLGNGTNLVAAAHAGKAVSGLAGELFARREGWNAVVTTPREPLAQWRGTVNDFRDTNLLELTVPVAAIEVRSDNSFTLQRAGSNAWVVAGEKFPVDPDQAGAFIKQLAGLQITDFVQDVVTASGLQTYGLTNQARAITLRSAVGSTNSVIAQILFGGVTTNEVYVKRSDEDFVYAVSLEQLNRLPLKADYFRDRQVWNFSEANVAQVTLRQNGKTRQLLHTGTNEWSLAPGSQGIINPPAVEETVHQLGQLTVAGWLGRKIPPEQLGLTTNSLSVTLELASGTKYTVDFGGVVSSQTAVAEVTLEGEPWAFVFPPMLYPMVQDYLALPAAAP
jgi:hypothetical protein